MASNKWLNMTPEDMKKIEVYKNQWHDGNEAQKAQAHQAAQGIKDRYGISESEDINLGQLTTYRKAAEEQDRINKQRQGLLTNITNFNNTQSKQSAEALKNFKYDPSSDAAYQTYVDMYNRQGQSAAKQTLNNVNAANMGRNSSYGAAATAQVQQAYAQKASEMIPTLAEQAYNKLLNQYNVDRTVETDELEKYITAYNTILDTQKTDSELKYQDSVTRQNLFDLGSDEQFLNIERAKGIESLDKDIEGKELANEEARLLVEALPQKLKDEATQRALNLTTSYWNNVGLSAEAREKQVAADIAAQFGIPMAAAALITAEANAKVDQVTAEHAGENADLDIDKKRTENKILEYDAAKAKAEYEALPQKLKDEATGRAYDLTAKYWNNVGLSAEARQQQVAADVAAQFGIPMAAAQYITTQAEATIAQANAGNIGTKIALENQAAGANIAAVQADTAYTKANTGLVTAKTETENVTNGGTPVVYTTPTTTPTTTTNNYDVSDYVTALKTNFAGQIKNGKITLFRSNAKDFTKPATKTLTVEEVATGLKNGTIKLGANNALVY